MAKPPHANQREMNDLCAHSRVHYPQWCSVSRYLFENEHGRQASFSLDVYTVTLRGEFNRHFELRPEGLRGCFDCFGILALDWVEE